MTRWFGEWSPVRHFRGEHPAKRRTVGPGSSLALESEGRPTSGGMEGGHAHQSQEGVPPQPTTETREAVPPDPILSLARAALEETWAKTERHTLLACVGAVECDVDPTVRMRYDEYKARVAAENTGDANERLVWHGCSEESLQAIQRDGFSKKCCTDKHHELRHHEAGGWQRFGVGFYFAPQSSKSHDYPLDEMERLPPGTYTRSMLLCKVVAGKMFRAEFNKPELKSAPAGYNSVHGVATPKGQLNYDEIAVYEEAAILPHAVVTYTYIKHAHAGDAVAQEEARAEKAAREREAGGRYEGDYKGGKPHGRGVFVGDDGSRYVGEWREGKGHGQGTLTKANGDRYEGSFKADMPHGWGEAVAADGTRYTGEWSEGEHQGQGVVMDTDGGRYEGSLKAGKPHGRGVFTHPLEGRYDGEFRDGVRHGRAVFHPADGGGFSRYEGDFKDNHINGQGTLWIEGGRPLSGQFRTKVRTCPQTGQPVHQLQHLLHGVWE